MLIGVVSQTQNNHDQAHEQVEMTYRSHNNATASMGGIGQSGESGYRCWRNATGSRDAVKGKRVGLELEGATVRHYTGFRVHAIHHSACS
jgi:hypothetical protein